MNLLENLRIPTLLGLFVLVLGLGATIYLTGQNLNLSTKAAPEENPKNILVTNIDDSSATISWQTDSNTTGFVTFGIGSANQTVLDDRDNDSPQPRITHHVSLKNLDPQTTYQFKTHSGKISSAPAEFTTSSQFESNGFKPIIGSVLDDNRPEIGGILYLQIDGAITQSSVIKSLGNFIIPISKIRSLDLKNLTPSLGSSAKLVVYSDNGQTGSATITIENSDKPFILKVGQNLDLTNTLGIATPAPDSAFDFLSKKVRNK